MALVRMVTGGLTLNVEDQSNDFSKWQCPR